MALTRRSIRELKAPIIAMIAATVGAFSPARIHAETPAIEFTHITTSDTQPGGPVYDFRISRFEIRNDQFVAFLNDALSNLSNPRGQYLYFDLETGDVYIHSELIGQTGVNGKGPLLFDAAVNGRIAYVEGHYIVTDPAFAAHPVTGVTWYSAVKFCN